MNISFFKGLAKLVVAMSLLGSMSIYAEELASQLSAKITKECVGDNGDNKDDCIVRKFKDSQEASLIRGKIAFSHYCVLCHGANGQGDGRAAKIHNPRPANLTKSVYPPEYIAMIIRKGGEAMGRSKAMPPWGEQLTDEQMRDIVNHVMSIRQSAQPAQ